MSFRSEELQASVIPKKIFGLDVIMYIGELRYKEHKSYDEITEALEERSIKISMGELTNLTRTFESLIKGSFYMPQRLKKTIQHIFSLCWRK